MKSPEDEKKGAAEPPGGSLERGVIMAKTGAKIGANYARYLTRRTAGKDKSEARSVLHSSNATDLFTELSKLRGVALKMAQGLSMEPGFLPEQFSQILAKAQYNVPPMGPALVKRLITKAFKMSPEKVFASFSYQAMAAASLGQVHRAQLHSGQDVAVKVQYPNVRESIDSDLKLMRTLAGRFLSAKAIDPYLAEFRDRMMEETDYVQEGQNILAFTDRFSNSKIVTPHWIPDYTTERVLTMTFVDGVHLKEFLASTPSQDTCDYYGQILWDVVHEQVAGNHLSVHADAHPGNFLFRDDNRLGILDFGCIKRFPRDFRDDLILLYRARMAGDKAAQEEAFFALDILTPDLEKDERDYLLEILDILGEIIESLYEHDMYDFGSGDLTERFFSVMPKFTGREAFKYRQPVGSHHFVFVNRLLAGMFFILTQLQATIDTRYARECLMSMEIGN